MLEKASRFIHDDRRAELLTLVGRANALSERKRWGALRDLALRAVERWPAYAQAWQMLGTAYFRLGEFESAEGAFMEALRLKPNDWWISVLLNGARTAQRPVIDASQPSPIGEPRVGAR